MRYETGKAPRLLAIATICALLVLPPVACVAGGAYVETFPRPFDSARWKAAIPHQGDEARCGMLADLKGRVGVVGRSRAELSQLLGEPEETAWDPQSSYWPLCDSFIDVWILRVEWQNGRAVSAMVHDT